jgi:hypothetical protein
MLPELQHFKGHKIDLFTFFGDEDNEGRVEVRGTEYITPGDPVGGSEMGHTYSIILMQEHPEEDRYHKVEFFEAILSEPIEYISNLIPAGWMGVIARKTTTSDNMVHSMLETFLEM